MSYFIPTPPQLQRLPSVCPLRQDTGSCFAHAIARSFAKTLQVLNVIENVCFTSK